MKKKFTMICVFLVTLALTVTVVSVRFEESTNISDASIGTYAAKAGTTSIGGFVSEKVDSVTNVGEIVSDVSDIAGDLGGLLGGLGGSSGGGLGDAIGGIGDALGGLIGNIGGSSDSNGSILGTSSVTYSVNTDYVGYIEPVPFASENNQTTTEKGNGSVNETVDFAANKNPYAKPTKELKGGDKGDGVKWMQWIFIYTRYGLKDDGITGVFDEDTVAVVKKLQKEKGLTVDGIVDDEVIAQIELLYFEATYSVTAPVGNSTSVANASSAGSVSVQGEDKQNDGLVILSIIVAVIWVIAIAFIVTLFLIKRKKKKAQGENKSSETIQVEENQTEEENKDKTNI